MTETQSSHSITRPVIVLIGPTAIGKTALSLAISREFNCEIISVDSMQVYRYMDIGTAKVSPRERQATTHHLIDICDPDDEYNASRFARDALSAITEIHSRRAIPLLTGGTGLYLRALKEGLFPESSANPEIRRKLKLRIEEEGSAVLHKELSDCDYSSAARIHPNDSSRILRALEVFLASGRPLSDHLIHQSNDDSTPVFSNMLTIGLTCQRSLLYERINRRTALMLNSGLEEEVRSLLERGYGAELKSMQSIGYRHMINHISGQWSLEQTGEFLARDTRHYAKRQFTWFNRDSSITWFEKDNHDKIHSCINRWLN